MRGQEEIKPRYVGLVLAADQSYDPPMTQTRLDPDSHPWLTEPKVARVIAALAAARPDAGAGDVVRFVGGCVRNAVIGRPITDIDLATALEPDAVVAALEAGGVRAIPTGIAYGTVTAVVDGAPFEVTTLRRDVETDGRRAVVAYSEDWSEDAARRDFRLNALYAGPDGAVFDPTGAGVEDALAGRVVFIGDADARIAEDYLRILRFFRFSSLYGRGPLDPDGLAACARAVKGLRGLSAERVWSELRKLLGAPDPAPALDGMMATGVLEAVLPEALQTGLLKALIVAEREEGWAADPMLRLMALIPRFADVAARVARRLKMSRAEADRLNAWTATQINPRLHLGRPEGQLAQAYYGHALPAALDRARLGYALDHAEGEAPIADWRAQIGFLEHWTPPTFPLDGEALAAAGVPRGPIMGATLRALEKLWVKSGFAADAATLLAASRTLPRAGGG